MDESMDRVLAYRNFLAAEDHLDEIISQATSSDERAELLGIKWNIIYLRDDVMPKEVDKRFHCLAKHLATAYEACREVAKATNDELDVRRAETCQLLLTQTLEKLWGRKITTCERCGVKEDNGRLQKESSGSATSTADDGLTGISIQGVSTD